MVMVMVVVIFCQLQASPWDQATDIAIAKLKVQCLQRSRAAWPKKVRFRGVRGISMDAVPIAPCDNAALRVQPPTPALVRRPQT